MAIKSQDGIEITKQFGDALAGMYIREKQRTERGERTERNERSRWRPVRGILLDECDAAVKFCRVATFVQADRLVYDLAYTGTMQPDTDGATGTITLEGNGGDTEVNAVSSGADLESAIDGLYGLTPPDGVNVLSWKGRSIIRFPQGFSFPSGTPDFTIKESAVSGGAQPFLEPVPWDVRKFPLDKVRFAGTMQGAVILAGRMVVVHQWDIGLVFTMLDGCPEFEFVEPENPVGGTIPGTIP